MLSLILIVVALPLSSKLIFQENLALPEGTELAEPTTEQQPMEVALDPKIETSADQPPEVIEPPVPEVLRSHHQLKRGGTLIAVLLEAGAGNAEAHALVDALRKKFNPRKLQSGQKFWVEVKPAGAELSIEADKPQLWALEFDHGFDTRFRVERGTNGAFQAESRKLETRTKLITADGVIDDSLYLSAERAGVPVPVIVDLMRIFSFSVDFQRDIWPGDRFSLLYERLETEDGKSRVGAISFGELVLRGKSIALYRFTSPEDGITDYYDEKGQSARRLLMRTPIDGARLTSRFGNRKHPVLGYTRLHTGVDFGANTGTPIMASGDGTIERASRYGNYGNYVLIRHNGTYKTAYAHLSRYGKGIRSGARVRQGDIIGYVGATGRVTGPHLHYEVFVNGRRINPMSLKLPSGKLLTGSELVAFQASRQETLAELSRLNPIAGLQTGTVE